MLSARLILVRHGQSTHNAQALVSRARPTHHSRTPDAAEAELLRAALPPLRRRPRRHERPPKSPPETAALVGYPDARLDPRFREINVGQSGRAARCRTSGCAPETAWRGGALKGAGRGVVGRPARPASARR